MTIRVSDLGITKYNSYSGEKSNVGYISYNERMNKTPVNKVNEVSSSTSRERSVAKEAGRDFVSASTPAYSVGFTSQGMSALKGFKALKEATKGTEAGSFGRAVDSVRTNLLNTERTSGKTNSAKTDKRTEKNPVQSLYSRTESSKNVNSFAERSKQGTNLRQAQAIKAYSDQMGFGSGRSYLG